MPERRTRYPGRQIFVPRKRRYINDIIMVIITDMANGNLPGVPRFPYSSAFPNSRQGPTEKIRIEDALGNSYLQPNEQQC